MLFYFTDKDGVTYERDLARFDIRKLLESGKYRRASLDERRKYIAETRHEEEKMVNELGLKDVFYMAPTTNSDGYGNSSRQFKARAVKHGYFFNTKQRDQKVGLCYHLPNTLSLVPNPVKIAYTMFESTQYPPFWEKWLASADRVLVPTQFCADVMYKNFGIMPDVVPLGIETDIFDFVERVRDESHPFTFLHYDAFKWRKGWDLVFNAFNEEFGETDGDNVRLILKTTLDITPPLHEYPKIKKIVGRLPQEQLMDVFRESDAFVFPTRGEGFGLTPLEALATGIPAIIPNHTGLTHYFDERYCYGLEWTEIKAKYDNRELRQLNLGTQWEPTIESLRKQMRQAYNDWKAHSNEQRNAYGREISEYARQFSIENTTKKLCEVLAEYV